MVLTHPHPHGIHALAPLLLALLHVGNCALKDLVYSVVVDLLLLGIAVK